MITSFWLLIPIPPADSVLLYAVVLFLMSAAVGVIKADARLSAPLLDAGAIWILISLNEVVMNLSMELFC